MADWVANAELAGGLLLAVILLWAGLTWEMSHVLGRQVEEFIDSLDTEMLGVEIEIESTRVRLCRQRLELKGVTVHNPPGYKSRHLLHVEQLDLRLNMCRNCCSWGKRVFINLLQLRKVDVIVERTGVEGRSNLQDLMAFVKQGAEQHVTEASPRSKDGARVQIGHVKIEGIKAKLAHSAAGGGGLSLTLPDMSYKDFNAEFGSMSGNEVVRILMTTVFKSVLHNLAGSGVAITSAKYRDCCGYHEDAIAGPNKAVSEASDLLRSDDSGKLESGTSTRPLRMVSGPGLSTMAKERERPGVC